MSPLTVFLAKFLGLYCILLALLMMLRKDSTVETMRALVGNRPLLLFVELLGLAGGIAMVIGHNVWSGGALPVVVTLLGWFMLLRGIGLLALPPGGALKLLEALRYEERFYYYMGGTLVLGLYLALAGFGA